ncbi:MAG: Com family DNA-binding transcriptional regulator [Pseudomonadota bacterium]
MKLLIRKLFCGNCQRLVQAREQAVDNRLLIQCPRCGQTIRMRDGPVWKPVK